MPKMKWVPTAANAILLFGTAAYAQNVHLKPVQTEGIANWTAMHVNLVESRHFPMGDLGQPSDCVS